MRSGYSRLAGVMRKWQVFPGNNTILCDGRIITAKDWGTVYFTLVIIVVMMVLFFVFEAPFLSSQLSPAVPVITAYLVLMTLGFLFWTSFTDPGFLPRATKEEALALYGEEATLARSKTVTVCARTMHVKYCFTCNMYRPPRTSHCSLCNNCVENFDHHCPWVHAPCRARLTPQVGNCIGQRNHHFFFFFVLLASVVTVIIFAAALFHIVHLSREDGASVPGAMADTPVSVLLACFSFLLIWSVGGLACYHSSLIALNMTTNEQMKFHQEFNSPFSQGFVRNMIGGLFGPRISSLLRLRDPVDPDDQALPITDPHTATLARKSSTSALL